MAPIKEQVVDRVPKRIKELRFGISSSQEMVKQSVMEVCDRHLYNSINQGPDRKATTNGPLDPHMGTSSKFEVCETCGEGLQTCSGHFGHVRLALPAFHIGYLRFVVELLHSICKDCSHVLLTEEQRRRYLRELRRPSMDNHQRSGLCKKIALECRKHKTCPSCGAVNGPVRKVAGHPLKIVHMRFEHFFKSTSKSKQEPVEKIHFDKSFERAKELNHDLEKHFRRAFDDLNPLRVLQLFRRLSNTDCELLGMNPNEGRPENFLWTHIPAPPISIRPSIKQDGASTEDDATNKVGDIVHVSNIIRDHLRKGEPLSMIMEHWEFMQIQIAILINSDVPGLNKEHNQKPSRGICQRLKGKQGRFRGNLSGKRVDFSGRTVISPDPNLGIDEVAVPQKVAVNLTYPERVSRYNIEKLRLRIRNGSTHPGANYIFKHRDKRQVKVGVLESIDMKNAAADAASGGGRRRQGKGAIERAADELEIGDVVERHLEDGDIVLFNRQPSLHKLSILSHRAKIRPWRTFRLNECVCNPYNADFDGDEMNLHVPQTEEARVEATELMGVKHNIATPKNGTPIIAAIQDFITGAYLLSHKDNFYNRKTFAQICGYMFNNEDIFDPETGEKVSLALPEPTIIKPEMLWTGKQVFGVLMRPSRKSHVLVNVDAGGKQYSRADATSAPEYFKDYRKDDNYLIVRNSEVMCGRMDKAIIGDGNKDSIFSVLMRDFGPSYAVHGMNRLAKLSSRWLTEQGFSIGIGDVTPTATLITLKNKLIKEAYEKCDAIIADWRANTIKRAAGCNEEETMESEVTGKLNETRKETGNFCISELSKRNAPMIMATAGSKGSMNNVAQMIASVGQQVIGGSRIVNGFQDRTLPHFPKTEAVKPASKGFVKNSFYSGLDPAEFIFHAMSGREGLVDTAVKTAETGYMSRRLMKSLEDLSAQYDGTVRNSSSHVVQFQFGDDGLDPADMEGKVKPVSFQRTFTHALTSTWDNDEPGLLPKEVIEITQAFLNTERNKYPRVTMDEKPLAFDDKDPTNTDRHESIRSFLDDLDAFIRQQADGINEDRMHFGKISRTALTTFLNLCLQKYTKSVVQPGHAVGAVGAQSIGEPGTQMTLKTFHFAGVAGMSITQGVPRIKEVINAAKKISTPVISCALVNKIDRRQAQKTKAQIEKTYLRDVIVFVEECWLQHGMYIAIRLDKRALKRLRLEIDAHDVVMAICRAKALGIALADITVSGAILRIHVRNPDAELEPGMKRRPAATASRSRSKVKDEDYYVFVQNVKRAIVNVVVGGLPDATRAVIKKDDRANAQGVEELSLLVEGYGLKACMNTPGVDARRTTTNSVIETRDVLGIEAARTTIIKEIREVMKDLGIDPRHLQLLADVMTYKGDVLGITRFGLAKMRDSVLQLASFEKTPDHLFEAAWRMKKDGIQGVSECIIMGQSVRIGTGASKVVRRLGLIKADLAVRSKGDTFERAFRA